MKTKSLFSLWALSSLGTTLAVDCSRAGFDSCMAPSNLDQKREACNSRPDGWCLGAGCSKGECVGLVLGESFYAYRECARSLCAGDATCRSKVDNIGHSCDGSHCGFGHAAIGCRDILRAQCRENFAAGASDYCDPCQTASNSCLAESAADRISAVAACDLRPNPTQVTNCKNIQKLTYDDRDVQCRDCVATCKAATLAPGTPYTCVIV